MNKKILSIFGVLVGVAILSSCMIETKENKREVVTMGLNASLREMTIDDLITEADIIVIGEAQTTLPSKWLSPNGKDLEDATVVEVFNAEGLFTDTLISVTQTLKGMNNDQVVRVRSFIGEANIGESKRVRWINNSEVSYKQGTMYLLFLRKDFGPAATVNPGDYISVNSYLGVYEITNGEAISGSNKWALDELIAYIQNSLAQSILAEPTVSEISTETPISIETISPTP